MAKFAAHLLELLALFWGQNLEGICLGLPGDNPHLGLDSMLNRRVLSEGALVEDSGVLVGRAVGLPFCSQLLDVAFFFDLLASRVDDGLDLADLLVAQTEFLGNARQHALEESESVRGVIAAEPTLASTMWSLAAAPGPAGASPVPGSGAGLSEDRCWRGKDYNRRYG